MAATYTVHDPDTKRKVADYAHLATAFRRAYAFLPLDTPGTYNPKGRYVTVQEWDERGDPLRQWLISGTMPAKVT